MLISLYCKSGDILVTQSSDMADPAIRLALDPEENELKGAKAGEGSWTLGRSFSSMWAGCGSITTLWKGESRRVRRRCASDCREPLILRAEQGLHFDRAQQVLTVPWRLNKMWWQRGCSDSVCPWRVYEFSLRTLKSVWCFLASISHLGILHPRFQPTNWT